MPDRAAGARPFVRPELMSLATAPEPIVAAAAPAGSAADAPTHAVPAANAPMHAMSAANAPTTVTPVVPGRSWRWPLVTAAAGVLVLLVVLALVVPRGRHRPPAGAGAVPIATPGSRAAGGAAAPGGSPATATGHAPASSPAPHRTASAPASVPAGATAGATATATGRAAVPTVNLALHKPTGESSHTQLYAGRNATDGDATSYWESADGAFPQWLQVDLGASAPLDHIVVRLPPLSTWPARTQTLSVQGSTDGAVFTTLAGPATYAFDPAAGDQATIHLGGGQTRFVRLVFTDNSVQHGGQIAELQVY